MTTIERQPAIAARPARMSGRAWVVAAWLATGCAAGDLAGGEPMIPDPGPFEPPPSMPPPSMPPEGACPALGTGEFDDGSWCVWWILGAEAGDLLDVGRGATFGDFDADGDADVPALSYRGDCATDDVGAGYVIRTPESPAGVVTDLATASVSDATCLERSSGRIHGNAGVLLADVDGDSQADAIWSDGPLSHLVAFGGPDVAAVYGDAPPDGLALQRITGAGGSQYMHGIAAADLDGDGMAEIVSAGINSTMSGDISRGLAIARGVSRGEPERAVSEGIAIGIGTVGVATQGNHTDVGGAGDFNGDSVLDFTAYNGAANDGMGITFTGYAIFGGDALPSSMPAVDGLDGFGVTGGPWRGQVPLHQQGDFDGDGIDDPAFAADTERGTGAYIVYGRRDAYPASRPLASVTTDGVLVSPPEGATFPTGSAFGMGDVDGDGAADFVLPVLGSDGSSIAIVWGGERRLDAIAATGAGTTTIALADLLATVEGVTAGTRIAVAIADIDGDVYGDLVIGLWNATTWNGAESGAAVVVFGSLVAARAGR